MFSKWLNRVFRDEVASAYILLIVALVSMIINLSPIEDPLYEFAHSPFLFGNDLHTFASEWLLCIFFVIAGIELRFEMTHGTLNTFKTAVVPVLSALFGIVFPVGIYLALGSHPETWGAVMPTDLPFALAVVAIFGKRAPLALRAFIISLAIVDDVFSLVAMSASTGTFSIHPTLLAVVVGFVLPIGFGEKVHHFLQPISSAIVLPIFAFTSLTLPLHLPDFLNDQTFFFTISRIFGKLSGILFGAAVAVWIFRAKPSLSWHHIAVVGAVCSVGFSVSLLFIAVSGVSGQLLIHSTAAIVAAIPASFLVGAAALLTIRKVE